jgi:hypothetical protein
MFRRIVTPTQRKKEIVLDIISYNKNCRMKENEEMWACITFFEVSIIFHP